MKRRIEKVLVANRGEIALRIIRTLREKGIKSVAVYSEFDRFSPYMRLADEVYPLKGKTILETYLNMEQIVDICKKSGAQAIHPGYGFLSENPQFARYVNDSGLIFIGPPPPAMELLGDKVRARITAKKAGVPIVPGSEGSLENEEEALKIAKRIGFPVMIKAKAGGGGKGMRLVKKEEDFLPSFRTASSEAYQAFGDGSLYIEKALIKPRHVEVQIIGDHHGNILHLFERDCSVQRRHQKLIEETPAPNLSERTRKSLWENAVKIARASGYRNAGTVEFLLDENENFYFMEVNARLQVEHPVTEAVTGLDLVSLQIDVEEGLILRDEMRPEKPHGAAMEFRLNAEDPFDEFFPSPGKINHMHFPSGLGIRVDSGIEEGGIISIEYDPLVAKMIISGKNREEVIKRAQRALDEVEICGIRTTLPFHRWIIRYPPFIEGRVNTELAVNFSPVPRSNEEILAAVAAIYNYMRKKETPIFPTSSSMWKKEKKWIGLF